METFIDIIEYAEEFKAANRTGWGCGYVHIPKDHPILVQLLGEENMGYYHYLQPEDCPEEITWSTWDEQNEYYVIGFDTAHTYNNDSHDEAYVTSQTNIIKSLVDSYTAKDAYQYALNEIDELTRKFNKYLL